MANLIPPPGTRGLYSLLAPFDTLLQPATLYKCAAIRSFTDVENGGKNVYETYYQPYQIEQSRASQDRKDGVYIVTLLSDKFAPIYVPSSFIASYPDQTNKNYHRVILSADLGPLPDTLDLTFVKTQMASVISQSFGVTPSINVAVAPMTGVVSYEEHDAREAARQGAITNSTTDYAKWQQALKANNELKARLAILEQIVKDKGLIK